MGLKSGREELRKRGMVETTDITLYNTKSNEELYEMIHSENAVERSAAVRVLAGRCANDEKFVTVLLNRLCKEKSLYTKLEICSVLEKGDEKTARQMVKYLGKIGNNQYSELPDKVSRKKSYPLPRDIIARTLSKMAPANLEVLLEVLEEDDVSRITEVIDAIGHMVFYNDQLATPEHVKSMIDIAEKYGNNKVILWKTVICLSAFPIKRSIKFLEGIKELYPGTLLYDEAERSLKAIEGKYGF